MPGIYGEKWAVSYDTEPPSDPVYFRTKESARLFFDSRSSHPGWGTRIHEWNEDKRRWTVVESK